METLSTKDFYYDLPEDRIAQTPEQQRDHSRLMVIHREDGRIEDKHFCDIVDYLRPGDLLIMNNTKVLPARIYGKKAETGGKVELLLLKRLDEKRWETMVKPGKKALPGVEIVFSDKLRGVITDKIEGGLRIIEFDYEGVFEEILGELGTMPLPPYIHEELKDQSRYQTVYAKHTGSAAAPTAGLHFTEALIQELHEKGVQTAEVTLHVGIGTFRPVKCDQITEHHMHEETYCVPKETAEIVAKTREAGGRVIAVGTTSVRTLESVARDHDGQVVPCEGATDIFIYPGYQWQVVDGLITNFHLPESTLLMLVSAFYEREAVLEAYRLAVEKGYRFFSFGDAMFIE